MSLSKKLDRLFEAELVSEECNCPTGECDCADIEEANVTANAGEYNTPKAFSKDKEDENNNAEVFGYKKVKNESTFKSMSKQMHLNEVSYKEYKTDENLSSRQKVNNSIKEVNGKLFRIERILDQNMKLKTESGIDESKYWNSTKRNLLKIEQKMIRLAEKMRSF
tara:strand:- start:1686 stop:2180 length:495 start_codon:yes stop_codon:yes gene_type:complete